MVRYKINPNMITWQVSWEGSKEEESQWKGWGV